ncbi:MAG: hypothetical protein Q4B09_05600 [Lachnospiraceae bacterium]|nr:hypothetical protein [Lachnospiraceae bacterium]
MKKKIVNGLFCLVAGTMLISSVTGCGKKEEPVQVQEENIEIDETLLESMKAAAEEEHKAFQEEQEAAASRWDSLDAELQAFRDKELPELEELYGKFCDSDDEETIRTAVEQYNSMMENLSGTYSEDAISDYISSAITMAYIPEFIPENAVSAKLAYVNNRTDDDNFFALCLNNADQSEPVVVLGHVEETSLQTMRVVKMDGTASTVDLAAYSGEMATFNVCDYADNTLVVFREDYSDADDDRYLKIDISTGAITDVPNGSYTESENKIINEVYLEYTELPDLSKGILEYCTLES